VARGERRALAKSLEKPLRRRLDRLRERLATWPARVVPEAGRPAPRFAAPLAQTLERHAEALVEGLAGLGPDANEAAHAARIRGKRLRYLVEPFVGVVSGCEEALARLKAVQDDLGALQDSVVLADTVAQGLEDAAVEQARALAEAARDGRALPAARNDLRAGLVALAQRVEGERRERGLRLAQSWREGEERLALVGALQRVVDEARAHAHAGIEIERKHLLRALPPLPPGTETVDVEQGWLPGERLQERLRRVRKDGRAEHWRTVKLGRGLTRVEVEEPCDAALFERLWPLTEGLRVTKRRHVVREGGHAFEIDEFQDRDLVLLEVELASADEEVELPGWLAPFVVREVTGEDAYVNRRLAR
jgi:CYTH domain-containing protein